MTPQKARIVFSGTLSNTEVTKVERFTVMQNGKSQVIHIVDYISHGFSRQMMFINNIEATMLGARYVRAQSKVDLCAKLEFDTEAE